MLKYANLRFSFFFPTAEKFFDMKQKANVNPQENVVSVEIYSELVAKQKWTNNIERRKLTQTTISIPK